MVQRSESFAEAGAERRNECDGMDWPGAIH